MATKFGYVERQATQVDWSAVGKQFTDVIQEESRVRQEKKAAIDEASREMVKYLQDAPTGDNQTAAKFTLDYANDAQALLLQQNTLLKAGMLAPRDYQVIKANLNDSTDQLFALSKEYQTEFSEKKARFENDESSYYEIWEMEQTEGLANIKNGKALINPNTGVVSIGRWEDGKMDGDPSSFATVNELRLRLREKTDRFKTSERVSNAVKTLGGDKWTKIIEAEGGGKLNKIFTISDKRGKEDAEGLRKEYDAWENSIIKEMTVNPKDKASILLDTVVNAPNGEKYIPTFDKSEAGGNKIFVNREKNPAGVPEFTDEQEKQIKKVLRERLRAQLETSETVSVSTKPFYQESAAHLKYRNELKANENAKDKVVNMMEFLWSGDATQKAQAETYWRDVLGVENFTAGSEEITIIDMQGNRTTIPLGTTQDGEFVPGTREAFFQAATPKLLGEVDISKAIERAGDNRYNTITVTQEMIDNEPDKYGDKNVGDVVVKGYSDEAGTGAFVDRPLSPEQVDDFKVQETIKFIETMDLGTGKETEKEYTGKNANLVFNQDDEYVQSNLQQLIESVGGTIQNDKNTAESLVITIGGDSRRFLTEQGDDASKKQFKRLMEFIREKAGNATLINIYDNELKRGNVSSIPKYQTRSSGNVKFGKGGIEK